MRFSIIVPVYNAGEYFDKCIESVLSQRFTDWELIIVDDGSDDGSGERADEYACADERISVIHKANGGQFFARRDGIERAAGEYIICLDSDDYWEDDCLTVLDEHITSYATDVIIFTGTAFGDKKGKRKVGEYSDRLCFIDKTSLYKEIISSHKLNAMMLKAIKRTLFDGDNTDYSRFSGLCYGEDKVQTLYIFTKAESVLYIPTALYNYRRHPSSVTASADIEKAVPMLANDMFELLYRYMEKWDMCDKESVEAYTAYYFRNYISVYYRYRRLCRFGEMKKQFYALNWKEFIIERVRGHLFRNKLTLKEKLKLWLAVYAVQI